MERRCHRIHRQWWSSAAFLLPFLVLAALPERLCAASAWDAWTSEVLEVRIRDGGGLAKIPDPATFGTPGHPFAPPHPYSGPPPAAPWFLNFLQIGSDEHPQLGHLLDAYDDFAGVQIARTGVHDDILVLELVNNTSDNLVFPPLAPISITVGAIPGPGTADVPGVLIDPGPLVPLPDFRPYPEVPYPSQVGNVSGVFAVNGTGASIPTPLVMGLNVWTGVIPPSASFGSRYLVMRITPQFPGAWRLSINLGIYRTIHVGGISEPPLSRQAVVIPMVTHGTIPSAPSETRYVYRIYNVGATPLNLTDLTFSSAPAGQIRLIEVLDQTGAVTPPVYPKPYGLPRVIPAYDGTASPGGPYAYTGGSSPVAPWVDVVLGVSPPPGNFSYTVLANYTLPITSVQWTVAGVAELAPEITVSVNTTDMVSDETVLNAGTLANEVPGRGRQYTAVIRNIGNEPLNLNPPTFVSATADGEVLPGGTWAGTAAEVVDPAESVTLRFRVWPTVADPPDTGPFAIEVHIPTNDYDEDPFILPIEGNASARVPQLEVVRNGRSISNGGADIETTVTPALPITLTYTLRNVGDRPLEIASVVVDDSTNTTVETITFTPTTLAAVDPITLAPGAATTFLFDVQTTDATQAFRARLAIASNSGSINAAPTHTFLFTVTDYKSDGGEGRECGFGSPFGFLLLIGGLLLWRRRVA